MHLLFDAGSTNFDARSFSVNDEANLKIYDREFAAAQVRIFEDGLRRSRRISLEEGQSRPCTEKLWEYTMGLFQSQLWAKRGILKASFHESGVGT